MFRRWLTLSLFALLALSPTGCAVVGGDEVQGPNDAGNYRPAMPAARIGLPPAYRPFYDELESYGDWTLIEPYGWVFRPAVNFVAWRPYQEGWWEPSDVYGWIWNSTEPFGWITYHYGSWLYDNYQGWVWQPGGLWAPSWVAWVSVGDLVGWAALGPNDYDSFDRVPGGAFTFIPARALSDGGAGVQASFITNLANAKGDVRGVFNAGHSNGVYFNRGPDAGMLSRLGAPMPAQRTNDEPQRMRLPGDVRPHSIQELQSRTERAVSAVARELRSLRSGESSPAPVLPATPNAPSPPRYKPGDPIPVRRPLSKPPARPLARDTSAVKHPRMRSAAPADSTGR